MAENKLQRTIKLSKTFNWEGGEIKEVKLDFSNVKGKTLMAVQAEFIERGFSAVTQNFDYRFLALFAEKVTGIDFEALSELNVADFQNIIYEVQYFLLNGELAELNQSKKLEESA